MKSSDMKKKLEALYPGVDVISCYTREDAIADGCLVDAGALFPDLVSRYFKVPVAFTATAWTVSKNQLADVLEAAHAAARIFPRQHTVYFGFIDIAPKPGIVRLKAVMGPDDGKLCLTVMLPDED